MVSQPLTNLTDLGMTTGPFRLYKSFMDEAHTGLGLIFLLIAFIVCGGIVIWLIISEGIRHTRQQSENPNLQS